MAAAIAEMSGAPRWDGTRDEDAPTGLRGAVITRIQGRQCWYATVDPFDENQRDEVRFVSGAATITPLTATRTQVAASQVVAPEWPEIRQRPGAVPDERHFRQQLEEGGEEIEQLEQITNAWLLLTCSAPGRRLTIRAFNPPSVEVGPQGKMHPLPSGGRDVALRAIYRIAAMARAPLGPGYRSGTLRLVIGRDRAEELRVDVATTRAGESLVVQRVVSYAGLDGLPGSPIAGWRKEWAAKETLEEAEPLLQSILERAGDEQTVVDRIWALEMLGTLYNSRHDDRARACFEEGLGLIRYNLIGGRAEARFRMGFARTEKQDRAKRAQLCDEARNALYAPGPARVLLPQPAVDVAESQLLAGQFEAATASAQRLVSADKAFFGAASAVGCAGLAVAAQSLAASGKLEEAAAMVTKLDASWCPPDEWVPAHARGKVEAASDNHLLAAESFRRALTLPHVNVVATAAALATELLAMGKKNEAISVARGVQDEGDWTTQAQAAVLERIRKMSPTR